jgi:hypothetical protein
MKESFTSNFREQVFSKKHTPESGSPLGISLQKCIANRQQQKF